MFWHFDFSKASFNGLLKRRGGQNIPLYNREREFQKDFANRWARKHSDASKLWGVFDPIMQSYPYYSHSVVIFREVGLMSTGPLFSRCPGGVRLAITTRSLEDEGQQLLTSASQFCSDVSFLSYNLFLNNWETHLPMLFTIFVYCILDIISIEILEFLFGDLVCDILKTSVQNSEFLQKATSSNDIWRNCADFVFEMVQQFWKITSIRIRTAITL